MKTTSLRIALKTGTAAAFATLFALSPASAATIATYTMDTAANTAASFTGITSVSNISASFPLDATVPFLNEGSNAYRGRFNAATGTGTYTFTVDLATGFTLQNMQLSLKYDGTSVSAGNFNITYDQGAGQNALGSPNSSAYSDQGGYTLFTTGTVAGPLTGDVDGLITFRVNVNNTNTMSGSAFFLDDVNLSATIVPEPGTFALLGLGGMALAFRRKRHR